MFRAKTAKRTSSKKMNNVSGPITPVSAPTATTAAAAAAATATTAPILINEATGTIVEMPARNSNLVSTETMLSALLDAESKTAVLKPWLRLERGLRMRLLRAYVENQRELTQSEKGDLLASLVEALDKKLLNSKSQITYNTDTGDIVEINALKIIQGPGDKKIFRIEPPHRSTKKARRVSGGSDSD